MPASFGSRGSRYSGVYAYVLVMLKFAYALFSSQRDFMYHVSRYISSSSTFT